MRLIAAALATWRIAEMITGERGPFAIFDRLRRRWPVMTPVIMGETGAREFVIGIDSVDEISFIDTPQGPARELGELLSCPYCLSPWVAAVVLYLDTYPLTRRAVDVLAIAGGAAILLDFLGVLGSVAGGIGQEAEDLEHGTRTD